MNVDFSALTVSATKPKGKPASMLAEMGIGIVPILEDEGNVDRYVLSKRLAIERRTGSSFLRGIMDKIWDLNLALISVTPIEADESSGEVGNDD